MWTSKCSQTLFCCRSHARYDVRTARLEEHWVMFGCFSSQVVLPDVEFLMNLGDYPLSHGDDPLPIISWCGSEQTHDIILPTYELTEATLQMLSRTTLDIFTMRTDRQRLSWSSKSSKGFFRGRDSSRVHADRLTSAQHLIFIPFRNAWNSSDSRNSIPICSMLI